MAKKTQLQELKEAASEAGWFVATWSPGDGKTRYRFFEKSRIDPHVQDYFGPASGSYTALGISEAWSFLGASPRRRPRRR